MATEITDHTAQALERLCQQFRDKPQITKLLTALTGTVQEAETALWELLTMRSVDTATGVYLDAIGSVVGQEREGLIDETYRRYIRARIATNRSRGTIGDVLHIANLVLNEPTAYVEIDNQGAGAYVLRVSDLEITDDLAELLLEFVRTATAAGVRAILEYATVSNRAIWGVSTWNGPDVWSRAID